MAFSSVRENVTPTHCWKLCWKMLLFIIFYFIFYYIIVTDVLVILGCYIGSLIEMNQNYYFAFYFIDIVSS